MVINSLETLKYSFRKVYDADLLSEKNGYLATNGGIFRIQNDFNEFALFNVYNGIAAIYNEELKQVAEINVAPSINIYKIDVDNDGVHEWFMEHKSNRQFSIYNNNFVLVS